MPLKSQNDDRAFNLIPSSPSSSQDDRHSPPFAEEDCLPAIKRRRRFTADETRVLEKEYEINSSPNQQKIQTIANSISTPRKIVTTWFQNRRAKHKRKAKLAKGGYQEDQDFDIEYEQESYKGSCSEEPIDNALYFNELTPQQSLNYRPIMPIIHQNQFMNSHHDTLNYFSGHEPYFFPYHQPFTTDNVSRIMGYQQDQFHHFFTSPQLESTDDNRPLYVNPADIYLETSDKEQ